MLTLDQLQRRFKRRSNKLKTRQLAFLEYTSRFYNANNRATKGTVCVYSPTKNSCGCAIGQHVPNKEHCKILDDAGIYGESGIAIFSALNEADLTYLHMFPEWMKDLGRGFLRSMQNLHDGERYWNDEGLTEAGRRAVTAIKIEFGL